MGGDTSVLGSLLATELRERLVTRVGGSHDLPENTGDHVAEKVNLLAWGAGEVGADVHLVGPGAVVNPCLVLSPRFMATATGKAPVNVDSLQSEGRVAHIALTRDGYSLLLTRRAPRAWNERRLKPVVTAFDSLLSSIVASRRARSLMEHTLIRELIAGDASTTGPWAESLGLPQGTRVSALVFDMPDASAEQAAVVEDAVRDTALATLRPAVVSARQGRVLALFPKVAAAQDVSLDYAVGMTP